MQLVRLRPRTRKLVRFPLNNALLEHARGRPSPPPRLRPAASWPGGSHDDPAGIDQLVRTVGVVDRLPLRSGAGRAQAAGNRIDGRSPGGFAAVARSGVGADEGSVTRLGSRSVMALIPAADDRAGSR